MADFSAYMVVDATGNEYICFVAADVADKVGVLRQLVDGAKQAFPVDEEKLKAELAKLPADASAVDTHAAYKAATLPEVIDLSTSRGV